MKLILLLAFVAPLASPVSAAEDPLLKRFVGEWTGKGVVQTGKGGEAERVLCQITNTLVEDGSALRQQGRCGVATNTGVVDGIIRATGGGRYEGEVRTLASTGPSRLSGYREGDRLVFRSEFTDVQSGQPATATTILRATATGYHLTSERDTTDGGGFAESDIVFVER